MAQERQLIKMWIFTQTGKLVNLTHVLELSVQETLDNEISIFIKTSDTIQTIIGIYKNKEKAIEELGRIGQALQSGLKLYTMWNN